MKLLFFDTETTGTNFWQHGIHQIAGIIEIDGAVKEQFNFKIRPNPAARIEDDALAVGHVNREIIASYEPMEVGYAKFIELLSKYVDKFNKADKFYLVGYNNASFDNQMLRAWFVQNGDNYFGSWFWSCPIDVFVLAGHKLLTERPKMKDFKLATVCAHMGITVQDNQTHDALYDVTLTRDLYGKVI